MHDNIAVRVNEIISTIIHCPVSDVTPDKHLYYDLLADSLMITDIILALEVEFSVGVNDAVLASVNYVRDLYPLVEVQRAVV